MPYLSELERGRKEASSEVLAAAAKALGLGLADLLALSHGELLRLTRPVRHRGPVRLPAAGAVHGERARPLDGAAGMAGTAGTAETEESGESAGSGGSAESGGSAGEAGVGGAAPETGPEGDAPDEEIRETGQGGEEAAPAEETPAGDTPQAEPEPEPGTADGTADGAVAAAKPPVALTSVTELGARREAARRTRHQGHRSGSHSGDVRLAA